MAVVPCLNEEGRIGPVVEGVRHYLPRVLVVDDGSTDGTGQAAREAGAQVFRHPERKGKGAALLAGWHAALGMGCQWAMTMDGDGQHDPADIPSFLACAERTGAALVSGNRMSDPANMPPVRRLVNRWMSWQISRTCGQTMPDTQCGFRLVDLTALGTVRLRATHFEIESEILLAFAAVGRRMEFVPIRVIYGDERSKINPIKDTMRWFRWWNDIRKLRHNMPKHRTAAPPGMITDG